MIRLVIAVIVLCSANLAPAAEALTPAGGKSLTCDSQSAGGDLIEFKCPLEATGAVQRFRVKANFAGSHDDTTASITSTLNDAPLVCDVGSKTQLMGEDGDVSLECKFQIKEKTGTKLLLGVSLLWSHAQFTSTEFVSE